MLLKRAWGSGNAHNVANCAVASSEVVSYRTNCRLLPEPARVESGRSLHLPLGARRELQKLVAVGVGKPGSPILPLSRQQKRLLVGRFRGRKKHVLLPACDVALSEEVVGPIVSWYPSIDQITQYSLRSLCQCCASCKVQTTKLSSPPDPFHPITRRSSR